jgi:hypothetical protein
MRYITKRNIPNELCQCIKSDCVYNDEDSLCDEPRINRGNSDAKCFRIRPRIVLTWLCEYNDNFHFTIE